LETEKKSSPWKRFLSTVGAGVIGSMLTLGVVFNTNLLPATTQSATEVQSDTTPSYNVEQTSAKNAPLSLSDMVEQASSAIVGVVKYQSSGNRFAQNVEDVESGTGSGVIYKVDGNDAYIVTNNHVIADAQKIEVSLESGETTTAELIGQDALSDLAVLKIDAKYAKSVLEFGDSDKLRAGDPVVAIGNPLGLEFSRTVTQGIVSAVDRTINVETAAGAWELNVIQTDAAINPGNSGGALLNAAGELIGINSLKIAQGGVEGLGFAIPSNEVGPLVDEIVKNGSVERPYIGVGLANLNEVRAEYVQHLPESVEGGAMIVSVDPESAAGKAGIKEQDIITEINDTAVKNSTELRKYLYSKLKVGDKASFTIYRGADKLTIDLTLTSNSK
jgi:serine protease Do